MGRCGQCPIFLVLPLVKLLGIGLGFSLYHFVNLVVGYIVGRNGMFGVPSLQVAFEGSLYFCDFGCGLILVSFILILFVEGQEKPQKNMGSSVSQPPPTVHGNAQEHPQPHVNGNDTEDVWPMDRNLLATSGTFVFALEADKDSEVNDSDDHCPEGVGEVMPPHEEHKTEEGGSPKKPSLRTVVLGVLLAILAGILAGVQSVPATLYSHEHPDYPSTAVVLPQCVGVWFASTAIYVVYSSAAQLRKKEVRHAVIRPAFLSGCFWAFGFSFMMKGIIKLGFAVGYTLDAVGPILVASLVSICWFKEISGRKQLIIYWSAEALQLLGVVLITVFSKSNE